MNWFRAYHGAPFDPKLAVIAKKVGCRRGEVAAVWWCILDCASQAETRGNAVKLDIEAISVSLDFDETLVKCIVETMREREMILGDGTLSAWEKRQPKREDSSTERVRAFRKRSETQRNAPDKRREEKNSTPHPPRGASDHPAFDEFWRVYPSRGQAANPRKPASERFSRSVAKGAEPAAIIRGTAIYAAQCRATGIDRTEKVAQATRFLNEERWRDIENVSPIEARPPPRRVPMHPGAGG